MITYIRIHSAIHAGKRQSAYVSRSGGFQRLCRGSQSRAGREYIVDQENPLPGNLRRTLDAKRPIQILQPLRFRQAGLRHGIPLPSQMLSQPQPIPPGYRCCQQFRLIEAALPLLTPMHRHRNDEVKFDVERNRSEEEPAQRARQTLHFCVLEEVDQLSELAVIASEGVGGIETHQSIPAMRAKAFVVQCKCRQEGSPAAQAKEFGFERPGAAKTTGTDRYTGHIGERLLTKAAIIGEKTVEEVSVKPLDAEHKRGRLQYVLCCVGASRETREGTPPLNREYTTCCIRSAHPATKLLSQLLFLGCLRPCDVFSLFGCRVRDGLDALSIRVTMSKLRVLLVHHDPGESDRISSLLEKAGHSVLALDTMADASEALGLQRFDAVLLPESTPADQLATFASGLRQEEKARRAEARTPIIVSSSGVTESQVAVAKPGNGSADAVIPNDFDPALFAQTTEQVRAQLSRNAAASHEEETKELSVFDPEGFRTLLSDNRELLDEIIGLFLDESGSQIREMEDCLRTGDFVSLAKVAHTLKGSLGTLHGERARSRAQSLEIAATRQVSEESQTHLERLKEELDELRPLLIRMRSEL
jgi:HPt (histidine-containing phosphotransfer) domain-containing protein